MNDGPVKMSQIHSPRLPERRVFQMQMRRALMSAFLISSGMIIIIGVGWFVWYDTSVQQRELMTSLFLPQTSALGLMIGIRMVDYLFIGCVLLISGLIVIAATRKKLAKEIPADQYFKRPRNTTSVLKWMLLGCGLLFELYALTTTSTLPVLIGLGLVFYSSLLFYMTPEPYIQVTLLDSTTLSMLTTLNHLLRTKGANSKAIYLPERPTVRQKEQAVITTTTQSARSPTTYPASTNQQVTQPPPREIFMDPPGSQLTNLFEQALHTTFSQEDLSYLQQNLPPLLINEYEMANELELHVSEKQVYMKIVGSIYKTVIKESRDLEHIYASLGCPFLSAIALSIVRASKRPVIIDRVHSADDYETIEVYYRIL